MWFRRTVVLADVDEGMGTPNYTDYLANQRNRSGFATMGLTSPASFSAPIYRVSLATVVQGVGFANDGVALYAQVIAADEVTPLTAGCRWRCARATG